MRGAGASSRVRALARGALVLLLLVGVTAAVGWAQEPQEQEPEPEQPQERQPRPEEEARQQEPERRLDPKERALERLRSIGGALGPQLPDTSVAVQDTVAEAADTADLAAVRVETGDPVALEPPADPDAAPPVAERERPADPVRPGRDPVRPGADEVPPGADGVRPGAAVGDTVPPAADPGREGRAIPRQTPGEKAPDSIEAELRALAGYSLLEYEGAGARFDVEAGRLELDGKARVDREGQQMTVDSLLVWTRETAVICGYGKPVLTGEGAPVESELVCYDMDRQLGMARDARTTFTEGATWFVHSREAYPVGNERLYSHDAMFTSCDLEVPHYHFGARSIKIVHDDILVARNVTLNFADVPVFWLPFMVQSLKTGRRSGLLTPRFSVNDIARTRTNYNRRIENLGFYWAMNEYMGAELALDWYSNNWMALDGRFQYNWREQFLNGGASLRRFWPAEGGRQFTLNTNNSWRPSERTSLQLSGNYASSSRFVQRHSFDPHELLRSIDSNAGITHRFDWGNLNLSASRRQHLSDDRVDLTLPNATLSLSPVTLFRAPMGTASWYNNATWTGSARFDNRSTSLDMSRPGSQNRDSALRTGSVSSSLSLGNLSWGQGVNFREDVLAAKPELSFEQGGELVEEDALPRELKQQIGWNTNVSYRLRLIGATSLSPSIGAAGELRRSPDSGDELVAGPTRANFNVSLNTDVFGFWPGVGPYTRIRHRVSPSIRYSYAPAVRVTERQREVFQARDIAEQNRITIGFNQTFEARVREDESREERPGERAPADARPPADGVLPPPPDPEDAPAADEPGEVADPAGDDADRPADGPRRLPRARTVTLLALNTSAVTYDFVRARQEGMGWTTLQIHNTVRSDLLQGFNLSFAHDLFERQPELGPDGNPDFRFAPHLSQLNASFSLDADSWIFRVLGIADALRGAGEAPSGESPDPDAFDPAMDPDVDPMDRVGGRVMGGPRLGTGMGMGGAGPWRASFNYSLSRPRGLAGGPDLVGSQLLSANMSFRPTENWSVHWSTAYSFTQGEFQTHVLTMTRDLHRWEANFDFVKAPNGNFSFQFRVRLRDNPDIKFDYDQRTDPGAQFGGAGGIN